MEWLNATNTSLILFFIGLFGLIARRNILKSIISITIIQSSIILFFIDINRGDPIAEALMITAIVIGTAVTSMALMIFIHIYNSYGTTNWWKLLEKRKGER